MSQKPDDVVASDAGGGFEPHPEGQFAAVCVDVVNLGTNVETFPGQPPREVPKISLVFVTGERQKDEAKSLALITTEMTNSAGEKANLRKFLESWRGKAYTPEQVASGLPVSKLWGMPALLSIEQVATKKGRKFAKIRSVSPLPKGMTVDAKALTEEYTRPQFLEDRKKAYAEALAKHRASQDELPEPEETDETGTPLPF